jgi:hypothetical protein
MHAHTPTKTQIEASARNSFTHLPKMLNITLNYNLLLSLSDFLMGQQNWLMGARRFCLSPSLSPNNKETPKDFLTCWEWTTYVETSFAEWTDCEKKPEEETEYIRTQDLEDSKDPRELPRSKRFFPQESIRAFCSELIDPLSRAVAKFSGQVKSSTFLNANFEILNISQLHYRVWSVRN